MIEYTILHLQKKQYNARIQRICHRRNNNGTYRH